MKNNHKNLRIIFDYILSKLPPNATKPTLISLDPAKRNHIVYKVLAIEYTIMKDRNQSTKEEIEINQILNELLEIEEEKVSDTKDLFRPYNLTDLLHAYFLYAILDDIHSSFSTKLHAKPILLYFLYSQFNLSAYLNMTPQKGKICFSDNDVQTKEWFFKDSLLLHFTKTVNQTIHNHIKEFLSDVSISSKYDVTTAEQRKDSKKHNLKQKQIFLVPGKNLIPLLMHFMYYDGRHIDPKTISDPRIYDDLDLCLTYRKSYKDAYSLRSYEQITKTITSTLSSMSVYDYIHLNSLFHMNKLRLFNSYIQLYNSDVFIDFMIKHMNFNIKELRNMPAIFTKALAKDSLFIQEICLSNFLDPMYIFHTYFYLEIKNGGKGFHDLTNKIEICKRYTLIFLYNFNTIYDDPDFLNYLLYDISIPFSQNNNKNIFYFDENKLIEKISSLLKKNDFVKYSISKQNNSNLFKFIDYNTIRDLITGDFPK